MRLHEWMMIAAATVVSGICLDASPAHAQGCPPGFYATGGGNAGWVGCAPVGPIEEEEAPEEFAGEGYGGGLPPMRYDPEQTRMWAEASIRADAYRESERMKDPVYRRLSEGYWEHFEFESGDPWQTCIATFLTPRGGVVLMDWTGDNPGTFIAFFGGAIGSVDRIERLRVTLIQSGEEQTVEAFHAPFPWEPQLGMVMFAVPSTAALLDNIEAVQDFEVKLVDQTLVWGEWHSGDAARERLAACVRRRSS
ncbi:hypothetical protein [Brevundimonas sp.]|jgi:hypothetical protein|uniref:hypothetical protein n=1 Tax=Brevundimonas sp. TaxID=1871086 RepID=UPI002E113BDD|nr:hypothetical protein [Brevundimonas sp.]